MGCLFHRTTSAQYKLAVASHSLSKHWPVGLPFALWNTTPRYVLFCGQTCICVHFRCHKWNNGPTAMSMRTDLDDYTTP